jgi:hypothetical protein
MSKTTRKLMISLVGVVLCAAVFVPGAQADFGIAGFDVQTRASEAGGHFAQAGGHPYEVVTSIEWNSHPDDNFFGFPRPDADLKDALVETPPGLLGNVAGLPQCGAGELAIDLTASTLTNFGCPASSQVGTIAIGFELTNGFRIPRPLFNMKPPSGIPARFGFNFAGTLIFLDVALRSDGDYGLTIGPRNTPQALRVLNSVVTFWGDPGDARHDPDRCADFSENTSPYCTGAPGRFRGPNSSFVNTAFITNPTSCTGAGEGNPWSLNTNSWQDPEGYATQSIFSHEDPGFPEPPESWGPQRGIENCDVVPFGPSMSTRPTTRQAKSPAGLNVEVTMPTDGFESPSGIAQSHMKRAVVWLPEGMTINPSAGAGLGVCTPAQFAAETATSEFGVGCPAESKIGTVSIKSPAIDEPLSGSLFIATPDDPATTIAGMENPFDSLLAMYMVMKNPQRGLLVKLAGKVETDPVTGQITTTFDDLPQLPFTKFTLGFREGPRSPLVTPQGCGTYTTEAEFTPWSDPSRIVTVKSPFQITEGIAGAACPSGGLPPFKPGLIAGTINNRAGSYSPFNVRLFRTDEEQEITHFSIKLPPGVSGKLAGIPYCPDSALAVAKAKTGREELANPSCPTTSEVGRTLAGAGVGSVLTYVPGKVYLAGPYNGSALSIVSITSAVAGPFDLGTVVVRLALRINPSTAEVFVDATGSDPLPHIINGITVHLRDIRVYVDRPEFAINPTSCAPTSTASTVLGSGLDFASEADDQPVTVSTRFQAADCASLGFKPKLSLRLRGGTHRADYQALRTTVTYPNGGNYANIARAAVTLPHAAFLAQNHIRTVCTRVQFTANACPAGSIYGHVEATSPLLDYALQGPVYLRSSDNPLPDLVAKLQGPAYQPVEIDLLGRTDSVKGALRNTFDVVPDAPVSKFTLELFGGKRALIELSTDNYCATNHRADINLDGQNGKVYDTNPIVRNSKCGKHKKRHGH